MRSRTRRHRSLRSDCLLSEPAYPRNRRPHGSRGAACFHRPAHPGGSLLSCYLGPGLRHSGVLSWDLFVLTGVSATLAAATLIAAWIPARRAAGTDPIEALRNE